MVNSEVAGVMFTNNPATSSKDEILIQSSWGLGESVVSGRFGNDLFILDKATLSLKKSIIGSKTEMIVYDQEKGYGTRQVPVAHERIQLPSLSQPMLKELGAVGIRIENHFDTLQDIGWAYSQGKLFILQTRKAR